jgi:5-formyltetrahydrofolate cyclo-ligase
MTKTELRRHIAAQKKQMGFQTLKVLSERVIEHLRESPVFQQAGSIGLYMPLRDEVDVSPLLLERDKSISIPAFDEALQGYRMACYTPELRTGKFGIPEPENPQFIEQDDLDLILVPGIAFDRAGGRLGRGGGFYDRLLPLYNTTRIGIGFDFQCTESIPLEEHDCRLDLLITESGSSDFSTNL